MPVQTDSNHSAWGARTTLVFAAFAVVAAFFLISEHRAHLLPYLPWLLLAACPLMHLFMHGRHSGHAGREAVHDEDSRSRGDSGSATAVAGGEPVPVTEARGAHQHAAGDRS